MTEENLIQMLLPSFIGIVACMVCLVGLTFAWFTTTVTSDTQTITTSSLNLVEIAVGPETATMSAEQGTTPVAQADLETGAVTFTRTGIYTVTLTTKGGGSGYFLIREKDGTVTYYKGIALNTETTRLIFKVSAPDTADGVEIDPVTYMIQTVWGTKASMDGVELWPEEGLTLQVIAQPAEDEDGEDTEPVETPEPSETPVETPEPSQAPGELATPAPEVTQEPTVTKAPVQPAPVTEPIAPRTPGN